MEVLKKDWLVRTRSGEILGPYDSRELVDSFQRGQFYATTAGGLYICVLGNHETRENAAAAASQDTSLTKSTDSNFKRVIAPSKET